jgi:hypothetical protein
MRGQRLLAKIDRSFISRFSFAAALASLTLILFACPNPTSTDLVLSVVGTVPPNGATMVDPGQAIVVTFNKDLDTSSLQQLQSPVTISPNTGSSITLTFSYDSPTKKLSIEPHPFFASNSTYTMSFETTLKDTSGATLPKVTDFSFTTGAQPAGDIQINAGAAYVTTTDEVTLSAPHNAKVAYMRFANNAADLSSAPAHDFTTPIPPWTLVPAGDGTRTVYAQFFDSSNNPSAVRSASIMRDTVPPTISPTTAVPAYYNMYNDASNPPLRLAAAATDATSGVASYTWTGDQDVTFDTTSSPNTPQSPAIKINGKDGTYNLTLTVKDNAGNPAGQSFTIIKDTVPPGPPTRPLPGWDPTSASPWFDLPYQMTWGWNASSPADTFQVLLNDKPPTTGALSLSPLSFGPVKAVDYGEYDLTVREVDEAGNQSDPLVIPILVTPVYPANNSKNISKYTGFLWRNFAERTGTPYKFHLWSNNAPDNDLGSLTPPLLPGVSNWGPWTPGLIAGQTYDWYVEWPLDNGTTGRSPPVGTNYTFTVSLSQ